MFLRERKFRRRFSRKSSANALSHCKDEMNIHPPQAYQLLNKLPFIF